MLGFLKSIGIRKNRGPDSATSLSEVAWAGRKILLNDQWTHEREYLEFVRHSKITGPLAMDLWVFGNFIRPGDCVLDAGANIGFTTLLAEFAGADEIHAFEPDPRLTEQLMANTRSSHKIHVHTTAVGRGPDKLDLRLSQSHNQGSTFSPMHLRLFPHVYEQSTVTSVDVTSIDDAFPAPRFNFLKIDVEGTEHDVLLGGQNLFANHCPGMVYVELYDEYFPPVDQFLRSYYSHCFRVACRKDGYGRLLTNSEQVAELQAQGHFLMPPSFVYTNFVPEQLQHDWTGPGSFSELISRPRGVG